MPRPTPAVEVLQKSKGEFNEILSEDAVRFLAKLHFRFNPTRLLLLANRQERWAQLRKGVNPTFLPETEHIRKEQWTVCEAPADLMDRRVEITGPVDRKMMINALNSGANVFMADFEDSLSPTWSNVTEGQQWLKDAVRRQLNFTSQDGKSYELKEDIATLVVRPRGWHLEEEHVLMDGQPMSASLFDFGLYFYHNVHALLERGSGPYFYLPKIEHYEEARLWNDVFNFAQDELSIPRGTIRATVLLETILAAFQMDEILYELRTHASGLNAGRWDYIFSIIKKFGDRPDFVMPDRSQITMNVPFMRAYCDLLVKTCHRRGAHAMGGMAAFIPSRKDAEINRMALDKVREDKRRETQQGFDGTWVAHPDLVLIAGEIFDDWLRDRPHQKDQLRDDVQVNEAQLIDMRIDDGKVTESGVRTNISVALQYLASWLRGNGAAAINNLMEDAATAEISRAQLWQWITHQTTLADGRVLSRSLYEDLRKQELCALKRESNDQLDEAARLLDKLVLNNDMMEFLTLPAYGLLKQPSAALQLSRSS
jgi:malate synthase